MLHNKQNSKNQPPRTAEVLLHSLSHYIKKPKGQEASTSFSENDNSTSKENNEQKITKHNDPFGTYVQLKC